MSHLADSDLIKTVILLASSVTIVPLFKRLGLGSVLGYLVAGCMIGPSVFGVIQDPASVVHLAELGVVMFLFIIGLEMHPERLWSMKKAIFGRGLRCIAYFSWNLFARFTERSGVYSRHGIYTFFNSDCDANFGRTLYYQHI